MKVHWRVFGEQQKEEDMKNIIKKSSAFLAAVIMTFSMISVNVYAEDDTFASDSSGNWFGAGQIVDIAARAIGDISNELFEAGYDVRANGINIGGSAFLAGNDVSANDSVIEGSLYMAGRNLYINSSIRNNIWAAGQNISIGSNTSVKGVHAAAATIEIAGTYEGIDIAAETVVFDAVVTGNVSIDAEHVTIGPNASVDGEITVRSVNKPEVDKAAKVDRLTHLQVKKVSDDDTGIGAKEASPLSKAAFIRKIKSVIGNLFRFALLALVLAAVFRPEMKKSFEYASKRPGAFWGFGALALIATPIALILLCITVIGLPVAGLTAALYVLALFFSRVFAFTAIFRELIFTRTGKRLNPVLEIVIAAMPAAVLKEIPILGSITGIIGVIYTMGYIVLAVADKIKSNKKLENPVDAENTETPVDSNTNE